MLEVLFWRSFRGEPFLGIVGWGFGKIFMTDIGMDDISCDCIVIFSDCRKFWSYRNKWRNAGREEKREDEV